MASRLTAIFIFLGLAACEPLSDSSGSATDPHKGGVHGQSGLDGSVVGEAEASVPNRADKGPPKEEAATPEEPISLPPSATEPAPSDSIIDEVLPSSPESDRPALEALASLPPRPLDDVRPGGSRPPACRGA